MIKAEIRDAERIFLSSKADLVKQANRIDTLELRMKNLEDKNALLRLTLDDLQS
jgi:hypothetical protein